MSLYTIVLVADMGKALYRGVNATKVDDYTITSILQRVGTPSIEKKENQILLKLRKPNAS